MKKTLLVVILAVVIFIGVDHLRNSARAADTSYVFNVIYFYPNDYTPDQRYIDRVLPFLRDVQQFYVQRDGVGKAFHINSFRVIKGNNPTSYYGTGFDTWDRVNNELQTGCGQGDQHAITLIFLARTLDALQATNCQSVAGWYSGHGANGNVHFSEALFDAELIASTAGYCPNGMPLGDFSCNALSSRGGASHEVGHVLTLAHPGYPVDFCSQTPIPGFCWQTVMWDWWYWGTTSPDPAFIEVAGAPELSTLVTSYFLWDDLVPTPTPSATPSPSSTPSITPTPTPAPSLVTSNIKANSIVYDRATITWSTSLPSNSKVIYGTTNTKLNLSSSVDSNMQVMHSVLLTGLQNRSWYYYKVISVDSLGRTVTSATNSFRTPNK